MALHHTGHHWFGVGVLPCGSAGARGRHFRRPARSGRGWSPIPPTSTSRSTLIGLAVLDSSGAWRFEEQFYFVWPWVVLFAPRRWLVPIVAAAICIAHIYRL